MDKLVQSLGITGLSRSQVSVMTAELDEQVQAFRTRPLDAGPYTFVAADALVLKVREGGRVVGVHALVATAVNGDGHREILGLHVTSAEDGAGWLGFFRDLVARGLLTAGRVGLVTSDAHTGLVAAIGATLPGASWQRCRTHYAANLMAVTPKSSWPWVKALLTRSSTNPTPTRCTPSSTASSTPWPTSCPPSPPTSRPPATTCWPSPPSRRRSGGGRDRPAHRQSHGQAKRLTAGADPERTDLWCHYSIRMATRRVRSSVRRGT
jgi:transposase-like protein